MGILFVSHIYTSIKYIYMHTYMLINVSIYVYVNIEKKYVYMVHLSIFTSSVHQYINTSDYE